MARTERVPELSVSTQDQTRSQLGDDINPDHRDTPAGYDIESQSARPLPQEVTLAWVFNMTIKTIGAIAFILSCVALWPTIASAAEARRATALAQWSSAKEFLDYCESHMSQSPDCLDAYNATLSPPPGYPKLIGRVPSAPVDETAWSGTHLDMSKQALTIVSLAALIILSIWMRNDPSNLTIPTRRRSRGPPSPMAGSGRMVGVASGVRSRAEAKRRRRRHSHLAGSRAAAGLKPFVYDDGDTSGDENFSHHGPAISSGIKRRRSRLYHRGGW